jgi:hypothetical protein
MSQADFIAKQQQILAIALDVIRKPNMPIRIFLQEAENLFHWCQQDKIALLKTGLDWTLVEDLPARIGALREAESQWLGGRYSHDQAQQDWERDARAAYALRDELLHIMRFAYRSEPALLRRVAEVAAGNGHADMIQDLNDLATLGRHHPAPLQKLNLDPTLLDRAAATADTISTLLAQVNGERLEGNTARVVRDQAYTLLKEAVDEVRTCGQYALWDNAARRVGYLNHYHRSHRRSAGGEQAQSGSTAAPPA